eukprot:TRINITY_DN5233_c0_g1_i4.p1 TRINITY_DN5233_c0_g1~~TRINITY_DN5233_c0_g1_i4.p1  ORF type:complete len:170 (-),score=34.18 TRINITY_DN5233_c0_g1_i4:58-501(-)
MARTRSSVLPCIVLACAGTLWMTQMGFVNSAPIKSVASVARAATDSSSDFDVKSLLEPVKEDDPEVLGRSAAFFWAHIGYLIIPLLKGVTLAVVFAGAAYLAANGTLTKNVKGGDLEETAKSVESVAVATGRQSAKLWNAVIEKVNV